MARSIRAALAAGVLLAGLTGTAYAAAPGNDDIGTPELIAAIPYTNSQDTTEATPGVNDPDCFGPSPTVWYAYTPADAGWLVADTIGSDYDTTLTVVASDGLGGYTFIDCNDDAVDLQSRVRFEAEAGVTYLFMAGVFGGGSGGGLVFNLDATTAPVHVELSLGIDPTGRFLRDGSAIVGVTISCNVAAVGWFGVEVRQQVGRLTVRGWSGMDMECGPEPAHYDLVVPGENGKFAGGMASVNLYAEAWSPAEQTYDSDSTSATVRLRK